MALKALSPFSLFSPNPHSLSSQSSSSSLSFLFKSKPSIKSLKPLPCSQSPIFLPLLEQDQSNPHQENALLSHPETHELKLEENEEDEEEEEEELDPIRAFFKSRSQTPDPKQEGRATLQRNRRASWHIAPIEADPVGDIPFPEGPEAQSHDNGANNSGSVVEEILRISRNLPENSTLGDFLGSYVGKVSRDESVQILMRMVEEGLIWSCLYMFEWMGLQEPPLVSPRACSVIFPALGLVGMGEKVVVLFENLPRAKEFRDVRVYNAAISGLAACQR